MNGLEIRRLATDDEAHACATLMSTTEPWITIGRDYDESRKLVTDPSREVWVAYDGNSFRGFMILNLQGAFVGYIQTVAVTAEARGSGVGSKLVRFAEERIFREFRNVFLCVSSFNPRAKALYERLGYELIGELKDYVVRGHSEFLMRKTIGPLRDVTPA